MSPETTNGRPHWRTLFRIRSTPWLGFIMGGDVFQQLGMQSPLSEASLYLLVSRHEENTTVHLPLFRMLRVSSKSGTRVLANV